MMKFNGQEIATDQEGYLSHVDDWSEDLAVLLSEQEDIDLTDAHWEIIHFVRQFYLDYKTSPAMRILVKVLRQSLGEGKGNSRYLYQLFPKGPAKQATKIAGLPKPAKCL